MKKLKFDHKFAQLVAKGEMRSTWRLFDDKDLSVNDIVELIDKVQPGRPETWQRIGFVHIDKVIEKRLGDLNKDDMGGHEKFNSSSEVLRTYQKYYGSNVSLATPVKIIYFDFTPINTSGEAAMSNELQLDFVKIYADGGSRGNPGPSAGGYVVMDMNDQLLVDKGIYLGVTTNNQAEYQALKLALEEVQKMRVRHVDVYMDSLLVVNQMKGIFKVKNRDLWPIHDAIKHLAESFEHITFTQVPRELNKFADAAVNRALDEALEKSSQKLP